MSSDQVRQERLEVHTSYLIRDQRELQARVRAIEGQQHLHSATHSTLQELGSRMQRLEEAIRLIKLAAGLLMLAVAASGAAGGTAAKLAALLLGAL